MRYWVLLFLVLPFYGSLFSIAAAQDSAAPVPALHPAKQLEIDQERTEQKTQDLKQSAKKAEQELRRTQKELVALAAGIKKNENDLSQLEDTIENNMAEQKAIESRLGDDKASISTLVLALQRLDRTPPEAILARPGAPYETAQSALLLKSTLPGLYGRAAGLKDDLKRLDTLLTELSKNQAQLKTASDDLAKKHEQTMALLEKRKSFYAQTKAEIEQQEKTLREIARKSDNLKDLVKRLGDAQDERTRTARSTTDVLNEPVEQALGRPTPIPKPGAPQLPINGVIRTGYGQTDAIGAQSQGLKIDGRPGALVVSPMGGVVRYAGSFKNYGQIIIVEHQKDYHSLIAGLARIDTVVGQSVAAGEPIGVLGKKSDGNDLPSVYYELRHKGQPINPSRRFAGL